MDIPVITGFLAVLFVLIALADPIAARLRLPASVVLATAGAGIAAMALGLPHLGAGGLSETARAVRDMPVPPEMFVGFFLPILLFQATLGVSLRRLADDAVVVLALAVVAVLATTLAVGVALWAVAPLALSACLLAGAVVSTTDPSAVVSIFRSISAPPRLTRIIEGESLLNDAVAIALFGAFLAAASGAGPADIGAALGPVPWMILAGGVVGWVGGRLGLAVMARLSRFDLAQISVSLAVPFLVHLAATRGLEASGVVAVVVAGAVFNLAGPRRIAPQAWAALREVWDLVGHWAGAFVFILAALLIPRLFAGADWRDAGYVAAALGAMLAARGLILFGMLPALRKARLCPDISPAFRGAILWGGLRGAITLALALAVTENPALPAEARRIIASVAAGVTIFTLLVQGATLRPLIAGLRLDRPSPIDEALSRQVVAVALQTTREGVESVTGAHDLPRDVVRSEAKAFATRLEAALEAAEKTDDILARDRVTLGLVALAGAERDRILDRIRDRTVSIRIAERALSDADRLIEATRAGGRSGYRDAARRAIGFGPLFRLSVLLDNRLGLTGLRARLTAERFEVLVSQRLILRDMARFLERRIRRIHGRRVNDILAELLDQRAEALDAAIAGLRKQYPRYAEGLERRFIRRAALRLEEREYSAMRADGLIGPEVFARLQADVVARQAAAENRPVLDPRPRRRDLVRRLPGLRDLDDPDATRLARAFRARFLDAGARIARRSGVLALVASGALETMGEAAPQRLGPGDAFGRAGSLAGRARGREIRAIAPSVLLEIDEARLARCLRDRPGLAQAIPATPSAP